MPDSSLSIIIPAYNCAQTIGKTIEAIVAQDLSARIEVIVVDDGSIDKTPAIVQSFPQVKYVRQENSGPAAARNTGARQSTGEYLFFTDSDCVPQGDWVRKILAQFEQDASLAVVAGSYGIANSGNRVARCIYKEIRYRHLRMPENPSYFGSFNFAIRRKIFFQVGGFDPAYRNASGEDNDLSYKIIKLGHRIYFAKHALVDHFHTESVKKYLREQYRHGFWRVKMYLRHPSMSRGDDYTFWKDIIEIPLALLVISGMALALADSPFIIVPLIGLLALVVLEIFYGLTMMGDLGMGCFWACIMLVRAFARALGFVFGLICFLPQKFSKIDNFKQA